MSRRVRSILAAVAISLGLACSPANVGGVDAGPSADQACADSAYAKCSRVQSCSASTITSRYGDIGTCESLMKSICLAALAAPSGGATTANTEACVQALPSWGCSDVLLNVNPPPECQQVTGSLAAGAGCALPSQCQSGFCAIAPGTVCGACAAPPQQGDSCAQLTSCGSGMSCLPFSSTCAPPAQPMAACAPTQTCTEGYECTGANYTTGASGTCQLAAKSLGDACSPGATLCDYYQGLTCNTQSKQCVASQFVGAGQPCNYVASANQSIYCGSGGKCLSSMPGAQGTCAGSSPVGGACDLVAGPECISPSRCIVAAAGTTAGMCLIPDATQCP